jgi:hypothetical protein
MVAAYTDLLGMVKVTQAFLPLLIRSKGAEDIFPDPASQTLADGWRAGVAKALERRISAVVLEGTQIDVRERL